MTTEAKGIGHGGTNRPVLGSVERQIEFGIDRRIISEVIDGRRNDTLLNGLDTDDRLEGTSGAEEVTSHRLS